MVGFWAFLPVNNFAQTQKDVVHRREFRFLTSDFDTFGNTEMMHCCSCQAEFPAYNYEFDEDEPFV